MKFFSLVVGVEQAVGRSLLGDSVALEGDEDGNFLERANFFRSEHLDRSLELVKNLSHQVKVDVDEGPDIHDAKVLEASDGVDVVLDKLWAAHAPRAVWCSSGPEARLFVFAQSDDYPDLMWMRPKSAFGLDY